MNYFISAVILLTGVVRIIFFPLFIMERILSENVSTGVILIEISEKDGNSADDHRKDLNSICEIGN